MSQTYAGGRPEVVVDQDRDARLSAADWLCLAATPTFAIMALSTIALGGEPHVLCSASQGASAIGGMTPMYLLMSALHSPPWLRLISGRRSDVRRSA